VRGSGGLEKVGTGKNTTLKEIGKLVETLLR